MACPNPNRALPSLSLGRAHLPGRCSASRAFALSLALVSSGEVAIAEVGIIAGTEPTLVLGSPPPLEGMSLDRQFFADAWIPDLRLDYGALPSLLFAGLALEGPSFTLRLSLDLREDFRAWLSRDGLVELPFFPSGIGSVADANFPSLGYLEWRGKGGISASLGRRQFSWGPGTWSLALSDSVPYLDHLSLAWETTGRQGLWSYRWIVASADRAASGATWDAASGHWQAHSAQKTLAAHRLTWSNDFLRLALGELNMIYGVAPDLQDLGPFLLYHNLYQDDNSNVLLDASAEALLGPLRVYGEYALDEYVLPLESATTRPSAMGWQWGAEFDLLPGAPLPPKPWRDGGSALREPSFARAGGLSLRYEHYRTSSYLYQRSDAMGSFAWPERRFTLTQGSSGFEVIYADSPFAYALGFPWGPDHAFDLLSLSWADRPLETELRLGFHRQGSRNMASPYGESYNTEPWLALAPPVEEWYALSLAIEWMPLSGLRLSTGASLRLGDSSPRWSFGLSCAVSSSP